MNRFKTFKNEKINYIPLIKFFEIIINIILIIISFVLVNTIKKFIYGGYEWNVFQGFFKNLINMNFLIDIIISNILYIIFCIILFTIYDTSITTKKYLNAIQSVFLSLLLASIFLILVNFFIPEYIVGPPTIIISFLIQFTSIATYKYILYKFIKKRNITKVLICGPKEEADNLAIKFYLDKRHLKEVKYICYEKLGIVEERVFDYIDQVNEVYITRTLNEKNKNKIILYCIANKYITAFLVPKTYEIGIVNAGVSSIDDSLTFEVKTLYMTLGQRFIKRLLDIFISFFGLIFLSPLFLICAIIIKLQDHGPVFFKQIRVTRDGKRFVLYKFRSMIVDAEKEFGAIPASEDDPRITKFGRIIRKLRIDELPQLLNVLKGEMSFVGPRALRVEEVEEFISKKETFKYRLNVKAGITGFAQTVGNYATSFDDKLRYDLYYIRKYSLWFDIKIILYTIRILFSSGSMRPLEEEKKTLKEIAEREGYSLIQLNDNVIEVKIKGAK